MQTKWGNVFTRYKQVVDASNASGAAAPTWKFLDLMDSLFGGDARIRPQQVIALGSTPQPTQTTQPAVDSPERSDADAAAADDTSKPKSVAERHTQLMASMSQFTRASIDASGKTEAFRQQLLTSFDKCVTAMAPTQLPSTYPAPVPSPSHSPLEERKVKLAENQATFSAFTAFREAVAAHDEMTVQFILDAYPEFSRYKKHRQE